ncbi:Zinc finger protein 358 [Frankliniella fusca]|uniref:Zinc finger protein 358 n=1 Tax=Frankliniella fusca TaxID=407009 RepID=A0AAE1LLN1_9NEOP|nr:Zinc finger protein 358 [Frankliniella fusca]
MSSKPYDSTFPVSCGECPHLGRVFGIESLKQHYLEVHPSIGQLTCGSCAQIFFNKTSLIRHIKQQHEAKRNWTEDSSTADRSSIGQALASQPPSPQSPPSPPSGGEDDTESSENPYPCGNLRDAADKVLINLRSVGTITAKAIERFQDGCNVLLREQLNSTKNKVFKLLSEKNVPTTDIMEVLNSITNEDPFTDLNSIQSQLEYYANKYGLVKPQEMFLGTRLDQRLDPETNTFLPTQVNETFQYISVIGTLKALLSNESKRTNMFKDYVSKDGVYRSFFDGKCFKDHPLSKHDNVLQILFFYDELEVAAALGSKCIIHKLGVFFFQVLNGPPHLTSKLSSIHLLALVYADGMKKPGAFEKVLAPFVVEMKQLSSEEGLVISLKDDHFTLRAVLAAVTADTLAAHELLGFLGPGAKYFCRLCMIDRQSFRQDGNAEAAMRTREDHNRQVQNVLCVPANSKLYGVKGDCPLNKVPYFHCVDGSVFDIFHDLLEGIVPSVLEFTLRNYIYMKELLTVKDFNSKVISFSYGVPDSKNKPSPNFMIEMLTSKKKLKQTGSQMWCLIRVFLFFLDEYVQEDDRYMELVFNLQDVIKLVFSFQFTDVDLENLDIMIHQFLQNFKTLHVDSCSVAEVEDNTNTDEEENVDDPDVLEEINVQGVACRQRQKIPLTVHMFNKLHHLKHYSQIMRQRGPLVRMWCAKFEASLKKFRQYAAICCNFRNPPKSMAQMFQLSHLSALLEDEDSIQVEFNSQECFEVRQTNYAALFLEKGISETTTISLTNSAFLNGED